MSNMNRGYYEPGSFEFFDSLPPTIRLSLAMADYNWCVAPILQYYEQTGSIALTIASIREDDKKEHRRTARREKRTIFGSRGQIFT